MKGRPRMLNEPAKPGALATVLTVLVYLAAIFLLVLLIVNAYFSRNFLITVVDGESMKNTFQSGDCVYTDVHATPERGQVIIVDVTDYPDRYPRPFDQAEKSIIKRLIATEGDTVKCDEAGTVWLKRAGEEEFVPLNEPYAHGRTKEFSEVEVGEGEIFFLGDNRGNSTDSRAVGCLKAEDVIGVVPQWAINVKWYSTGWENFRTGLVNFFRPSAK